MITLSPFTQKNIKEFFRLQKRRAFEHAENPDRLSIINKKIEKKLSPNEVSIFKKQLIKKICAEITFSENTFDAAVIANLIIKKNGYKESESTHATEGLQKIIEEFHDHYSSHKGEVSPSIREMLITTLSIKVKYFLDGYDDDYLLTRFVAGYFQKLISTDSSGALIRVAVGETFFNVDNETSLYYYLEELSRKDGESVYLHLLSRGDQIRKQLRSTTLMKMKQFCRANNTPYLITVSLLQEGEESVNDFLKTPQHAEGKIQEKYSQMISRTHENINMQAIKGTLLLVVSSLLFFSLASHSDISTAISVALLTLIPLTVILLLPLLVKLRQEQNKKLILIETLSVLYKKEILPAIIIDEKKYEQAAVVVADTFYKTLSFTILAAVIILLSLTTLTTLFSFFLVIHIILLAFIKKRISEEASVIYPTKKNITKADTITAITALPFVLFTDKIHAITNNYQAISLKIFFLNFPVASRLLKEKLTRSLYEKKEKIYQ